jgi:uncharacterized membrane protein YcjF (UPF0283 family)
MKTPEDPLDALLRESDGYLEDNGFTQQVMAALPRRRRSWLRPAILLGAATVGFALIAWWMPPLRKLIVREPQGGLSVQLTRQTLLAIAALVIAAGSLVWSIFAAVKWED